MAQGYVRQSAADIQAGEVVKAAPINAELNQLQLAFSEASGHTHDGTTGGGAFVPLLSDADGDTKIHVETTADEDTVRVTAAGTEALIIANTSLRTSTGTTYDIGTSSVPFSNAYFATANLGNVSVTSAATFTGTVTFSTGATVVIVPTISDLNVGNLTVTSATSLDDLTFTTGASVTFPSSGSVNANGVEVTNAADPSAAQSLVTRTYLETVVGNTLSLSTISTTTAAIAVTSAVDFTLVDDLGILPGAHIIAQASTDNWVFGEVTAYNSGTKVATLQVTSIEGSGTYSSWNVSVSGVEGPEVDTTALTASILSASKAYSYFIGSVM